LGGADSGKGWGQVGRAGEGGVGARLAALRKLCLRADDGA
jgi:hypothetical protein